ncbi:Tubby protein-like [Hondaea fermentalgiana]|uniref:Tubby protein-like n=1 Tax=Hondaea fermentalgiana TaxID=2315210 RepID=A0A2R5GI17_9STRA|nr:Tubby protein-like [Hondaea fermentalgiana]|eukprot:GBG27514.1 Tubby protein-like [Hondaea fermentalgiana]
MAHLEAGKIYVLEDDFHAEGEGEVTALKGQHVTVLEPEDPNNPGWIFVQLGDSSGFVPSDFLADADTQSTVSSMAASSSQYGGSGPPSQPQQQHQAPPPIGTGANFGSFSSAGGPPQAIGSQQAPPPPIGESYGYAQQQQQQQPQQQPPPPIGESYGYPQQQQQSSYGYPQQQQQQSQRGFGQQMMMSQGDSSYSGFSQNAPLSRVDSASANRAVADNEAKFKADQRLISLDLWKYREELLGGRADPPQPPGRRWFYRDFFEDLQGPFNSSEMKERLHKQYVKNDSKVLMETGFGELASKEEEVLCNLFRSPEAAFVEGPRLTQKGGSHWFFVGTDGEEMGPFSTPQMLSWYQSGYIGGELLVRLANGKSSMTPLKDVYPDPQNAFRAPPLLANFDPSAFPGQRTVVLTPPPRRSQERAPDPMMERVEIAEPDFSNTSSRSLSTQSSSAQLTASKPKSSSKPGVRIVYGDGFPSEFNGIPSPLNLKQNVYSSMLYTFVTRPLHPDANTVQCYIRRDIDGSHVNFNVYRLFLEETNTPILTAFRHHHTVHTFFDIKLNTTGKLQGNTTGLTIAHLELNFGGTSFLAHNNVPGHQGTPKDLAACTYEKNRVSSKGPRKMKVAIPAITDDAQFAAWKHDGGVKNSSMLNALKSISTKDLTVMINKPPTFNKAKGAYQLNFGGRVTRSSVKNFQLVDSLRDPDHKRVILQHGRVGVNKFTMDVQHPMSLMQGFAIALSSLHTKKSVN